ncbi:MAG: hypothetical protein N2447_05665 [Thermoanaerobaculum sp.]|nr:hypothetical protein [Thermoanaerobaculum sp.]
MARQRLKDLVVVLFVFGGLAKDAATLNLTQTQIVVATEGGGAILGAGDPSTCNLYGAMVWNGYNWVVNTTWAHKYFQDPNTGQRLKNYSVVEFQGAWPTGVVHESAEFRVLRTHVLITGKPEYPPAGVAAVRYLIQDVVSGREYLLQSLPLGADGRARFEVFLEAVVTGRPTLAVRGNGQWLGYPQRAQEAANQPVRGADRAGEVPTASGWYFFDVGGGSDMGGLSYELFMFPHDPAGVQFGGSAVARFSVKWMDGSGNLKELRFWPALVEPYPTAEPVSFAGVARLEGANNTRWRSEVVLHNPGSESVLATLELRARDTGAQVVARSRNLSRGETWRIADLYGELGAPDGAGLLRVGGPLAWVRTFNQGANGTFGQDIPAVTSLSSLPPGVVRVFPVTTPTNPNTDFRSNLLLLNFDPTPATCSVGTNSGTRDVAVAGGTYAQINGVGSWLSLAPGVSVISVTCDRNWAATVSTVDPVLGDPTTVRGAAPEPHFEQRFAGVASVAGAGGTQWRSELVLYNVRRDPVDVTLALIPIRSKDPTASLTVRLQGREVRRVPDVYTALNAPSGSGMLRVTGPVLAWVRTFNQGATATFGQDLPMLPACGTRPGVEVLFPISTPGDINREPRSNLLLVNYEGRPTTVTVRSGNVVKTHVLAPGVYDQVNNLGSWLGLPPGFATVTVRADGAWSGIVSTVDPPLGDPTTVLGLVR